MRKGRKRESVEKKGRREGGKTPSYHTSQEYKDDVKVSLQPLLDLNCLEH